MRHNGTRNCQRKSGNKPDERNSRICLKEWYAKYQSRPMYDFAKMVLKAMGLKGVFLRHLSHETKAKILSNSYSLDWSKSKAYFAYGDGIRVNLKGREPEGIVEPGAEFKKLRDELRRSLLEIKDGSNGERVISRVWFAEEIYSGDCLKWAPDIVVEPNDEHSYTFIRGKVDKKELQEEVPYYTGNHRSEGIFAVCGPGVKQNSNAAAADITDLAPTILYQLGLDIPGEMDGKIIKEAFTETPVKREVKKVSDSGSSEPEAGQSKKYTAEQEQALKKRLENLGYLD